MKLVLISFAQASYLRKLRLLHSRQIEVETSGLPVIRPRLFAYHPDMPKALRYGWLLLATLPLVCFASTDQPNSALARAEKLSSLTGPDVQPFHLKLNITETAHPTSPYSATIEEYWKSSRNWIRTVESPDFKQQVTVVDGNRTEQSTGEYYPLWLRNFVTAATDPLEDASFWEKVSAKIVLASSTNGHPTSSCARAQFKIGTAAVNNDAFAVICFNSDGTLASVVRPGYEMEFHDQRPFGKKRIAYRYVDDPEPGTELVGNVLVLERIDPASTIPNSQAPSLQQSGPVESFPIGQEMFEKLLRAPLNINWPSVHSGNTSGKLSMYVAADREGRIREAYPLNSDNSGLQDAVRDQLLKVELKPAALKGQKIQTEAALTFQFSTNLDGNSVEPSAAPPASQLNSPTTNPIIVSPAIANALRLKAYAPVYPQTLKEKRIGGKVELTAIIGQQGQIVSLSPIQSSNQELTEAAIAAAQRWTYKPYLLNGSPVEIQTVITVIFNAP
jgi:TonB family protein